MGIHPQVMACLLLTMSRLLGAATTLLTLLSSSLNVKLLTSQLLSAPAIWHRPDGLRTTIRILGIFNSASLHLLQREDLRAPGEPLPSNIRLTKEEWVIAVIKGADDKSPRWRHLLVLGGLLLGFEGQYRQGLSTFIRRKLENAIITAANLALREVEPVNELAASTIAIVLSHVFDILSPGHRIDMNHELLLPILVRGPYFSKEGLYSGYLISTMDADIVQVNGSRFDWSTKSPTYVQLQRVASGPLIASLGSLSRLTASCVEKVQNIDLLVAMLDDLSVFTRSLCIQWRQNKLSEIDITEEGNFLGDETLKTSLPLLWRVLKSSMFAIIVILQALLGRVMGDARMPQHRGKQFRLLSSNGSRQLTTCSSRRGLSITPDVTRCVLHLISIGCQCLYPVHVCVSSSS